MKQEVVAGGGFTAEIIARRGTTGATSGSKTSESAVLVSYRFIYE